MLWHHTHTCAYIVLSKYVDFYTSLDECGSIWHWCLLNAITHRHRSDFEADLDSILCWNSHLEHLTPAIGVSANQIHYMWPKGASPGTCQAPAFYHVAKKMDDANDSNDEKLGRDKAPLRTKPPCTWWQTPLGWISCSEKKKGCNPLYRATGFGLRVFALGGVVTSMVYLTKGVLPPEGTCPKGGYILTGLCPTPTGGVALGELCPYTGT